MTKVVYPSEGLYSSVSEYIGSCNNNLVSAVNSCHFSIPNGFSYTNYVNGLYDTINGFVKEIKDIKAKIRENDMRFDNLSESLSNSISSTPSSVIEEREQIIKF